MMDAHDLYHVEQVHYTDQRLGRVASYAGRAAIWDEDEANAVLVELIKYFGLSLMPPPPLGLPGANNIEAKADAMEVINSSVSYLAALAFRQPRRQINAYEEVQKALRDAYWRGYKVRDKEYEDAFVKEMAEQIHEPEGGWQAAVDDRPVYFIGGDTGPIKIGLSTNPTSRLRSLQTSNPIRLAILALTDGGRDREAAYHAQFADWRGTSEWFQRCPEIEAEIARLNEATA